MIADSTFEGNIRDKKVKRVFTEAVATASAKKEIQNLEPPACPLCDVSFVTEMTSVL